MLQDGQDAAHRPSGLARPPPRRHSLLWRFFGLTPLLHPPPRFLHSPAALRSIDSEDNNDAFMAFIKETVLQSFDGEPLPDDLEAMLKDVGGSFSGGSFSSLFDLDRTGSVNGGAAPPSLLGEEDPAVAAGNNQPQQHKEQEQEEAEAAAEAAEAAAAGDEIDGNDDLEMEEEEQDPVEAANEALAAAAAPSRKRAREASTGDERAAAAAAGDAAEGDRDSVDTLPMPSRRRRIDSDEVTSTGANDLVEPAPLGGGSSGNAQARTAPRLAGAPEGTLNNAAAAAAAAAAAEAEGVFKAVLVAKVLTKSDASSKRIILPRIAIEANLPEMTAPGARTQLAFDALDRQGREWPLCIKAWANGANPKPVYVLEGKIGDLMKAAKLGPGDCVGVLASKDGRHFVHWNTPQVREAAARPTFCAFEFEQHEQARQDAAQKQQQAEAAAAEKEHQKTATPPPATAAAASDGKQGAGGEGGSGSSKAGPGKAGGESGGGGAPTVTAVPLASVPLVPGMPLSPCEMLVMGPPAAVAVASGGGNADVDAPSAVAPPGARAPSYLRLDSTSSAVLEVEDPTVAAAIAKAMGKAAAEIGVPVPPGVTASGAGAGEGAGDEGDGPAPAAERVGGIVHQGGALLCPRTAGCTRPAGHQVGRLFGWLCLLGGWVGGMGFWRGGGGVGKAHNTALATSPLTLPNLPLHTTPTTQGWCVGRKSNNAATAPATKKK